MISKAYREELRSLAVGIVKVAVKAEAGMPANTRSVRRRHAQVVVALTGKNNPAIRSEGFLLESCVSDLLQPNK